MSQKGNVRFREVQRFRQAWLWAVAICVSLLSVGLFGYGMFQQLVHGKPWGDNPMSDTALLIVGPLMILFGTGILVLFCVMKLITEVRDDGIYIRFFPLHRRFHRMPWEDVSEYEVRTYRPILEYGGWGIRYGIKGRAYNVSGNRGVQLVLHEGKRLLTRIIHEAGQAS